MNANSSAAAASLSTHAKALEINLNAALYGTFAEIGAGQEVARWFLTVGAASGTVAQTICAYDKTFSDKTYGEGSRYVSRERAVAMLDHEYKLLLERLTETRGGASQFFVFADSIATRNFKGDNEQHGWIGVRFQTAPGAAPSDILLHINLREPSQRLQQETIGVLGVNLIYAAFHQRLSIDAFLAGLFDGLSIEQIEIDLIDLAGPAFVGIDARMVSLAALRRAMCRAVIFDQSASVVEPSAVLRKRPLIVERGRFKKLESHQRAMLDASVKQLQEEKLPMEREPVCVLEMTIKPADQATVADDSELLERVDQLVALGTVIVSAYSKNYLLVHYLQRFTAEPIRMVVGVANLVKLLHRSSCDELPGSVLEGLARMLAADVKLYVFPMAGETFRESLGKLADEMTVKPSSTDSFSSDDIAPPGAMAHLYRYLRESGNIVPIGQIAVF